MNIIKSLNDSNQCRINLDRVEAYGASNINVDYDPGSKNYTTPSIIFYWCQAGDSYSRWDYQSDKERDVELARIDSIAVSHMWTKK